MKYQPVVKVGQYVEAGKTVLGYVGTTGKSTGSHVHHDGTLAKPVSWHQYHRRPLSEYFDTIRWQAIVMPYAQRYLTSFHAQKGHIGVDINIRPTDDGFAIYSPVNGRIVYVEPSVTFYRFINGIKRVFSKTWGRGFGNFLWIEEDMSSPSIK